MGAINYLNLSNGIEALGLVPRESVRFMRLQSTSCEQKHWAQILDGLPEGFLLDLAAGHDVVVHDRSCTNRAGGLSRAQWQGLEWVRYALARAGWGLPTPTLPCPRNWGMSYWRSCWDDLPQATLGRLRWFSRWVQTDSIQLRCEGGLAKHDGDSTWHRKQWAAWQRNDVRSPLWCAPQMIAEVSP